MRAHSSRQFLCLVATSLSWATSQAYALSETRVVGDEVRIELNRRAQAMVEHRLTVRVSAGTLRTLDLVGIDPDATHLDASVTTSLAEGPPPPPVPIDLAVAPDRILHMTMPRPRGLSRGIFVVRLRYEKNFGPDGSLSRDGSALRLVWRGPMFPDGVDGAKCTFVLPLGASEPRPAHNVGNPLGAPEDPNAEGAWGFLSSLHRFPDRDELSLQRSHVANGERVDWAIRLDPDALSEVRDSRLRPPAATPTPPQASSLRRVMGGIFFLAIAAGYSTLVATKAARVRKLGGLGMAAGGGSHRPLLSVPTAVRAMIAGPLLAISVALQSRLDDPFWGSLGVLCAMCLSWYLPPVRVIAPRGPGKWLPLTDTEALASVPPLPLPTDFLDTGTVIGRRMALVSVAVIASTVAILARTEPFYAGLVMVDSALLAAVFATGGASRLLRDPQWQVRRQMRKLLPVLRGRGALRASAWGRFPDGACSSADELRVWVIPAIPRAGLVGLEIGFVRGDGLGGPIWLPEILVRVSEGSPCHGQLSRQLPNRRWVRGRKPEERVLVVAPKVPTARMTAMLVTRLVGLVQERVPPLGLQSEPRPKTARSALDMLECTSNGPINPSSPPQESSHA